MKKFLPGILTLLFFTAALNVQATRRYVDASAAGTNNGTSWTNAYTDLQAAIAASSTGDSLWIADGTYTPHASTRSVSFSLNGLALIGGFAGGESTLEQRDILTNATILSGDLSGNDVGFTNNSENSYRVIEVQGTGNTSAVNGITVSGANSSNTGAGTNLGGGIKIMDGTGTTLKINNCIIEYNAAGNGGGLYVYSTVGTHTVTIENTVLENNTASAGLNGSAIYRFSKIDLTVRNCTFVANPGSALYSNGSLGSFIIQNSIFQGHSGTYILGQTSAVFSFDHCLFSDDPSANASITTFTNNLINSDALLAADKQLQAGSPAIDAGDNSVITSSLDLAGNTRILDGTVDMGAFEYVAPLGTNKAGTNPGLLCFPNPVQEVLHLRITEGNQRIKSVILYDNQGKELSNENYADTEMLSIHLNSLESGIYLMKIVTSDRTQFVKLVK